MKCYTEVRFFKWKEDEVAVSLRNRSGSYGGGSEVLIVVQRRFSDVRVSDTEVSPAHENAGGRRRKLADDSRK